MQNQSSEHPQAKEDKGFFIKKFMVGYLYFIQGVFLNMPSTITLTYKNIPSYEILGYFSLVLIPFSLKFISAPLIEKFTSVKYGRRKTWLVISLFLASILLIFSSQFAVEEDHQIILATIFFFITFFISLEDICTDGLAIKQLRSSQLASYLQLVYQLIGGVFGNLVFLELTSLSFAKKLGYTEPILAPSQFIILVGAMTFLSGIIIHFFYQQTVLKEQEQVSHTLLEVILHYKHFFDPKFRLCRQALINLLLNHGLHYFGSSYAVQLLKNGHISKQTLTTVSNFMILPILFITHFVSKYFSEIELAHKRIRILLLFRVVLMGILFFGDVVNPTWALIGIIFLGICSNTQFYFNSLIVNTVTDSKFAGMYVTMMASSVNLGNNTAIHLEMISKFGIRNCTIGGFGYTIGIISLFSQIQKWIKLGQKQKDFGGKVIQYKKQ